MNKKVITEIKNIMSDSYVGKNITIRNLVNKLKAETNWRHICEFQTLSEDFIKEFQAQVNWKNISEFQSLSGNFIIKFKDRLDLDLMLEHNRISKIFYHRLKPGILKRVDLLDI